MIPTNFKPTGPTIPDEAVSASGVSPRAWGVGALVRALAEALEARFNPITVRGEITGFSKATSGHCYFTLKDADPRADSSISCAMFRRVAGMLDFSPKNGDVIELRGRVTVYAARGSLQLVAEHMAKVQTSQGELWARFEALKQQLAAEGLFDAERKRAVPRFVRHIAVVTSLQAAALKDVLAAMARRAPHVVVTVFGCAVQGGSAIREIGDALSNVEQHNQWIRRPSAKKSSDLIKSAHPIDAVLLVRGGGSFEDLWAFNEQSVVRAVVACSVPLICGVGHETDFSLCDFAADLRAPTPTAAAELVSEPTDVWLAALDLMNDRLSNAMHRRIDERAQRLDQLAVQVSRPQHVVQRWRLHLERLQGRVRHAVLSNLQQQSQQMRRPEVDFLSKSLEMIARHRARLDTLSARLDALNPQHVLARGYAMITSTNGHAITSVASLHGGQHVVATLSDGRVGMVVGP